MKVFSGYYFVMVLGRLLLGLTAPPHICNRPELIVAALLNGTLQDVLSDFTLRSESRAYVFSVEIAADETAFTK
jgi:hypothetical protein